MCPTFVATLLLHNEYPEYKYPILDHLENLALAGPPEEVEDVLETDSAIFETPVPSILFTIAYVRQ